MSKVGFSIPLDSKINELKGIYTNRNATARKTITDKDKDMLVQGVQLGRFICRQPKIENRAAYEMAAMYAAKRSTYMQTPVMAWQDAIQNDRSFLAVMSRAAAQAEMLEMSFADYQEAQFYFVHQREGRCVKSWETASLYAMDRAREWLKLAKEYKQSKTVSAATTKVSITKTDRREHEEHLLRIMVKQWGSEEKVWEMFGDDDEVFDYEFRSSREAWQKIAR